MPPWSTRLLSGGSSQPNTNISTSSDTTPARSDFNNPTLRNKPLPRAPQDYLDQPPTLNHDRNVASPTKARAQGTRQHAHGRSASGPLPKIFGRKKSNGDLILNDTDVPLNEDLVPVERQTLPTRVFSGKKGKGDVDGKASRNCMCCDSRVKVPKDLHKFRCMACLTINDLKPIEEQSETDKDRPHVRRPADLISTLSSAVHAPVSVEQTRDIIRNCITAYLQTQCTTQDESRPALRRAPTNEDVFSTSAVKTPDENSSRRLEDLPLSTSPPDTPREEGSTLPASATIRDWSDLERLPGPRNDTPPPEQPSSAQKGQASVNPPARKPVPTPAMPVRKPPPPPAELASRHPSQKLLQSGKLTPNDRDSQRPRPSSKLSAEEVEQRRRYDRVKSIFRPLEDYMVTSFANQQCLNTSFSTAPTTVMGRARSESNIVTPPSEPAIGFQPSPVDGLSELDAKTLLLGDIGENGSWWTGKLSRPEKHLKRKKVGEGSKRSVSSRSPNIDWDGLKEWYDLIHSAGDDWSKGIEVIKGDETTLDLDKLQDDATREQISADLSEAREHTIRTLLKITENILKRPTRPMKEPEDLRFLLILLCNPSLYPSSKRRKTSNGSTDPVDRTASSSRKQNGKLPAGAPSSPKKASSGGEGSQHNGLLKRIFGLIANAPETCHRYLINWFARLDEPHFVRTVDLVASFINYRIARRSGRPRRQSGIDDGGLIPDLSGSAMSTSQQLHSAMGLSGSLKKSASDPNGDPDWAADWQIKAAAKFMSLLFTANNVWQGEIHQASLLHKDSVVASAAHSQQAKAKRTGQLIHTSGFYNTLLDYQDMIADFKVWETKREKFAFCQYPLFLSMGTKIKILEYDARRQMEVKAREAYFDQVIRQRAIEGNFNLRIRRECMVDDSLRQISEAVGSGQEELKKGLRVHFQGEEGVDAGGPRKEWFLMIVRDIFDPNHGMFVYDEESQMCYFNANSFETSDQYYLVGALLGLAIYNSTILDVAFPPFAFRKLLAAAPSSVANASNISSLTGIKGQMTYTLTDLGEFRPSLAAGLQKLLDFDGDVEATYCWSFVAPVERYGTVVDIPLKPNGENIPVTNVNRQDFVDAYVRYLLDTAVSRQFEPFKRGFFTVCAGNALSLFRAEEIELLIRGSDEALDVDSLRAVAVYENWKHFQPPHQTMPNPAESVPVIAWFWELFAEATPETQRKLLTFITGTDRIPAVGATSLVLRIQAGGDGWGGGGEEERKRFPVARTCFNMLILWRYDYREQLEEKLWRAVEESEGFGLK